MRALFPIEPLLELIETNKLILTPNNRLRNQIKLAYQLYLNNEVAPSPRVYSFSEWQNKIWQAFQNAGQPQSLAVVAHDSQVDSVWQQVIATADVDTTGTSSALEIKALARKAREAHQNLLAWQQDYHALNLEPAFVRWCEQFELKLQQNDLILPQQMQSRLLQAFNGGSLKPEEEVYLHSFIEITPLAKSLLESAGEKLIPLSHQPSPCNKIVRTEADTSENEIRAASHWAWQILQNKPMASIAIVAPQLSRDRALIERVLGETFESHRYDPSTPRSVLPFNISAALTLNQTPLIASALQLLQLNQNKIPIELIQTLLHNPFYGCFAQEFPLRHFVLEKIKSKQNYFAACSDIAQLAQQFCDHHSDDESIDTWQQFSKNLQAFIHLRRQQPRVALPSQWLDVFSQQLSALAWPGARRLDSLEYQQFNHWTSVLEQCAALDDIAGPISIDAALSLLTDNVSSCLFQPETRDTPIYVLGSFEAVGLQFSHCWVMGINDRSWPAPLKPNALLPKPLQSRLQMPMASLTREISIAQHLIQHFKCLAETTVFSYAQQIDNAQVGLSSFIAELEMTALEKLTPRQAIGIGAIDKTKSEQQRFNWTDCQQGPPLLSSPERPAMGGHRLLSLQAQCPFNAFAEFRLGAKKTDAPSLGFGVKEKGIIIHNALATIWEALGNQANLIALTDEELQQLVNNNVVTHINAMGKDDNVELGDYYYQLEQQRFVALLLDWLNTEKQRPPFQVIATEKELRTEFNGLHLRMRIDRVDQLENGELLLIDYKSKSKSESIWVQERLEEAQLPLYILCYPTQKDQSISAISFAAIDAEKMGFRGVADQNTAMQIDGVKPTSKLSFESWSDLVKHFETALQLIAQEVIAGDCRVLFAKNFDNSRDPLTPLNRYYERDYLLYLHQELQSQ